MATPKRHIWLCACLLSVIFWTCDAPHTNPFDPLNPKADWAALSGTARSTTSDVIADVIVRWNDDLVSTTNSAGFYQFDNIHPRDGWLYFSKAGYLDDSSRVEWNGRKDVVHNITLRKNPVLTGRVQTESLPRRVIDGVKVTWHPGRQYAFTDDDGVYLFEQPVQNDGLLTFEKEGYRTLETTVAWPPTGDAEIDAYLNANPQLEDFSLYSSVINYYEPRQPTYEMLVTARLQDPEDDITAVFIDCEALGITANLDYNVLQKQFERSFSARDLGLESMREVVGYDFHLNVVDESGYIFNLAQQRVVRVVTDEIEIDSPKNNEQVGKNFTIKWQYFDPGFKFTYHIKIYTNDDFTPDLVWQAENIPAETDSVIAELGTETDYAWEIWCVDEFKNRSRSKPGSFTVKD